MGRYTDIELRFENGENWESEVDKAGYDNIIMDFDELDEKKYNKIEYLTIKRDLGNMPCPLPKNLIYIEFYKCFNYNIFKQGLPNTLTVLNIEDCQLLELPELPPKLTFLNCRNNFLKIVPELPKTLQDLHCRNNRIVSLPKLPDSLIFLDCSNNKIRILPEISDRLMRGFRGTRQVLFIYGNPLEEIPRPYDLDFYAYSHGYNFSINLLRGLSGPIKDKIVDNYGIDIKNYVKDNLKRKVNFIGEWFLDCKYNPKYAYCRRQLKRDYDEAFSSE